MAGWVDVLLCHSKLQFAYQRVLNMEDYVNMSLMSGLTNNNGESAKLLMFVELSLLALLFMLSFMVNLSLLLVFARKESLRTTSNTLTELQKSANCANLLVLFFPGRC